MGVRLYFDALKMRAKPRKIMKPERKIRLDRFSKIEPGKEASFMGCCGFNQSIDGETRLKDLAPEEVRTRLEVKRIIFLDKTIIDLR